MNAPTQKRLDPRLYQIACLGTLLVYGLGWRSFDVSPAQIVLTIGAALATQAIGTKWAGLPFFDAKSALISGISLCLLLRVDSLWLAPLASVIAVGSKFVIRWNGKHIFNPTNLGVAAVVAMSERAWVSPAQWGAGPTIAFLVACLGGMVVNRAARSDVAYAFVGTFAAILFGRALYIGQPWSVPIHQLESGSLLLFTFFMISDPKTTPNARIARFLFGALVAAGAAFVAFVLFRPSGPIWSLVVLSPLVPFLDRIFPGRRYEWTLPTAGNLSKGEPHDSVAARARVLPGGRALGVERA
ncbi:MAG TPA: RnfABCDGE type electron transport complex subunit D [Candidatus Eisenbacteria bacterium]|nr:RnfABCDGE type electron transport complex subunit D [Candidatus Eisenbacteria bacterium]